MSEITCRIMRGDEEIFQSDGRGIAPLIALIESGMDIKDCVAYDKIVGRAAALLYVLTEVKCVHAEVMSAGAAEVLRSHAIAFDFETLTDKIVNRRGDGICPMEQTVEDIFDAKTAFVALKSKLEALRSA